MNPQIWNRTKVFFFDLDGCIYFGDTLAEKAKELLQLLAKCGKMIAFITNNSRMNAQEIYSKLQGMGLEVKTEQIITATESIGPYITERYGKVTVKAAGSDSLKQALAHEGHRVLEWMDEAVAEVIVIGRDTEFDYQRLHQVANERRAGAQIISTNPDYYHPGIDGEIIPESGAMVASIEAATGVKVESIGKPETYLFEQGLQRFGIQADECIMVGDNLHTDIAGAIRTGMYSVWVRHGAFQQYETEADERCPEVAIIPTVTVESLRELFDSINREGSGRIDDYIIHN